MLLRNNDVDQADEESAFVSIFSTKQGSSFVWFNQYQVEQTARKVTDWYGLAMSRSSCTNFCVCGKQHALQPNQGPISNKNFHGISDGIEDEKIKNKIALLSIGCPFKFCVIHMKKEDKCEKTKKPVSFCIPHQTQSYIEQADFDQILDGNLQILNPPKACHTMLTLIKDGPIHPLHLRNFLKRYYPGSQAVTAQMMFNFCMKC